ncbi:adenylyl-sulfate kinase 3-like [Dorcoceras hygrometricum]|uniref:Adenylyl-sulfate kinase 3-like n=1 Tax=Dorcoceras hygrometricum TaxID=472368 RepID=A0A2Z7CSI0_9LAMI|nr:adenylyl-sulfate kinase 3-like [Dorcoceras hygrometricum]
MRGPSMAGHGLWTEHVVALVMVAAGSRRAIVRVIEEATHVWFEEPVADEKRRRLVKWKRCVLGITSGTSRENILHPIFLILFSVETLDRHCSFEHFSRRFLPIPALVLGDFGGAEFTLPSSFDCYPLEAVERLVEQSVELLVCEEFWRNLAERSLGVVRFWIPGTDLSSRESLP